MNPVIEMVTFKLVNGSSDAQFLDANQHLNDWVKRQPGFRNRTLVKQENGVWMDMVQWDALTDAKVAAEQFMRDMSQSECMALIDPDTVVMAHHPIHMTL